MGNVYMEADQIRYKGQYRTVQEALDNGGGGGGITVIANPEGSATADLAKLQVGTTIYGIPAEAGDISYDNTSSGMTADDVQDAIDELSATIPGVATTSTPGIVQPDGTTVTIEGGVISAVGGGGGVAASVVGPEENGTTAVSSYAIGEHFIKNNKFCTATAAITAGDTLTLNTNYIEGSVASVTALEDYSSHVILNNNITWLSANTSFKKLGNIVYFTLRGTFPGSISSDYNLFTLDNDVIAAENYNIIFSSVWSSPGVIGAVDCYSSNGTSRAEVAGNPSAGGKSFIVSGYFLVKK